MSELLPVIPLTGNLSNMGELTGDLSDSGALVGGEISNDLLAAHKYTGDYTVYPRKVSQTLQTSDKLMVHDVEIEAINYSEISNPAGGETVNIGYE